MSQDQHSEGKRAATRHHVPVGVSVSLTLATKQSVFVNLRDAVNLRDVSEHGACVLRQGSMDIKEDDTIIFEARNYDAGSKLTLRSKVLWVRNTGFNTYVGLAFVGASLSQDALTRLVA
ncbi:PilZ domain-containing protein [Microcystis elabens FACHB-917]|nr:PilZ domain-containing protein [Microcystis elabens FACHB-917]